MQHLFAIHNKPIFAVCRLMFILSSADAETSQREPLDAFNGL